MKKLVVLAGALALSFLSACGAETVKSAPDRNDNSAVSPTPTPPNTHTVKRTARTSVRHEKAQPTPKVREPVPPAKTPKVIRLSPVTAIGSQKTIDQGKLVTWMTEPTCLIAGHNTRGWAWLDNVATGKTVVVKTGPCQGTYKVVGHRWQSVKGGPVPSWMASYGLILQTCTGRSGMGFSLLKRA